MSALRVKLVRSTRVCMADDNQVDDSDRFLRAVRPLFVAGRVLSVLPLQGRLLSHVSTLRFRWCSFGMAYFLTVLTGGLFMLWRSISNTTMMGWNFDDSSVEFYTLTLLFSILFVDLARKWPQLAQDWQLVEQATARYSSPSTLANKVKAFTMFTMIACTVEHILAHTSAVIDATHCSDGSLYSWMEYYYRTKHPQIFSQMPYAAWAGILVSIINVYMTLVWNYSDLFIIVVSTGLVHMFKHLSSRLHQVRDQFNLCGYVDMISDKTKSEDFWRRAREEYNRLSWLCLNVDRVISKIVLLSFTGNVYFICMQLYHSIRTMNHAADIVYFYYSLGFLLVRSMMVATSAASVQDETKEPLSALLSVPSGTCYMEVQRFLHQVTFDDVVLTGMNFFSVTRSLILTIAGTIVTYEIFMIQFHNISVNLSQEKNNTFRCIIFHKNDTVYH